MFHIKKSKQVNHLQRVLKLYENVCEINFIIYIKSVYGKLLEKTFHKFIICIGSHNRANVIETVAINDKILRLLCLITKYEVPRVTRLMGNCFLFVNFIDGPCALFDLEKPVILKNDLFS